jgi:hypothetical protein
MIELSWHGHVGPCPASLTCNSVCLSLVLPVSLHSVVRSVCRCRVQFADVRAFQELTGHYDAMTLQGGHGVAVVGGNPPEKGFAGAQWFKLVFLSLPLIFFPEIAYCHQYTLSGPLPNRFEQRIIIHL